MSGLPPELPPPRVNVNVNINEVVGVVLIGIIALWIVAILGIVLIRQNGRPTG
ncbi:MAG: hypothetical protein U0452_05905 [Anaerolineae bacterium]